MAPKAARFETAAWTAVGLGQGRAVGYGAGSAVGSGTFAGVDVDVNMNPKMGDLERDFAQTSRSRVEMSAGQRISPNNANLSEIGG
jgi:hypothetical protein